MKRNALVFLSTLILLSASSAVFAVGPDPLIIEGDCDGWTLYGEMAFGAWDHVGYDFTLELYQDGVLLYTYYEEGTLYASGGKDFSFSGEWEDQLCGEFTIYVVFWWYGEYGPGVKKVETTFDCTCAFDECTYTPGYWKNHEEAWPVEGLTVGCVEYTKAELLDIFDWPTNDGDMTIKLFHHLVAAKLNVLNGADGYIMEAINAGDHFLCMNPLGSNPSGDLKDDAEAIKDELEAYNEIECDEEDDDLIDVKIKDKDKAAAATQESSWGAIKKKQQ